MRILKQAEQWPWRTAADDFDEEAFWKRHQETMRHFQDKADNLKYVTPKPGVSMAVGPDWSGSVPEAHPDYIPGLTAKDDIHGYLHHDDDGNVHFVYTNPNMRGMGIGKNLLDHAGIADKAYAHNYTPAGRGFADALGLDKGNTS
jgi:GNAT superfamily N-acetyltransferase